MKMRSHFKTVKALYKDKNLLFNIRQLQFNVTTKPVTLY